MMFSSPVQERVIVEVEAVVDMLDDAAFNQVLAVDDSVKPVPGQPDLQQPCHEVRTYAKQSCVENDFALT
jgi:hypothetical protein